jgi:hypothetical protein
MLRRSARRPCALRSREPTGAGRGERGGGPAGTALSHDRSTASRTRRPPAKTGRMESLAARYLDLLAHGYASEIRLGLTDEAVVDDPRAGRVAGLVPVDRFLAESHLWLHERGARVEPVRVTARGPLVCAESVVRLLEHGRSIELPAAVVAEHHPAGGVVSLRVYHSLWPLEGHHRVRPPLLHARHDLALPPVVAAYQAALAAGDLDAMLAQFEPDGLVREPSGGAYVHRGPEGLRRVYAAMFSNGGGIALEHCTATDDGTACALEYSCVGWGRTALPPQAGVAVYQRGPSGKLAQARIYDDVDPPLHA